MLRLLLATIMAIGCIFSIKTVLEAYGIGKPSGGSQMMAAFCFTLFLMLVLPSNHGPNGE